MVKNLTFSVLFVLVPTGLCAQTRPAVEVFAGDSFMRAGDLNAAKGWTGSFAANLNRIVGIVADVDGDYYSETAIVPTGLVSPGVINLTADAKVHTLRGGPRFTMRPEGGRINPFIQALFGIAHTKVSGNTLSARAMSACRKARTVLL